MSERPVHPVYGRLNPLAICPGSGLTNRECIDDDICDCFPAEEDRFGIHPEYFHVVYEMNDDDG
jgi:hypothetical protein